MTPQAEAERAARVAREAAALRANLVRRKQQQRGRGAAVGQAVASDETEPEAHEP